MAATQAQMYRVAQMGGCTVWLHLTTDTKANVVAPNYFNACSPELNKGDIILVSAVRGGTPTMFPLVVISGDGASTITTAYGVVS